MTSISNQFAPIFAYNQNTTNINNTTNNVNPNTVIGAGANPVIITPPAQQPSTSTLPDSMVQALGQSPVDLSGGGQLINIPAGNPNLTPQMSAALAALVGGMTTGSNTQPKGTSTSSTSQTGSVVNSQTNSAKPPMDVYDATGIVAKNFSILEKLGVDGKGKHSGDGEIDRHELERAADPKTEGIPAELRDAAKMMLDNKEEVEGAGFKRPEKGGFFGLTKSYSTSYTKASLEAFAARDPNKEAKAQAAAGTTGTSTPKTMEPMKASSFGQTFS